MKDVESEVEKFILLLAKEESSIFDVLSEVRQAFMSDKSYDEMKNINDMTILLINKLFNEGK